jgi:bifunctional enzyme CysN/CysC
MNQREQIGVVITGHVDHGKSTLVGRLLADTGTIPDGKLESVRRMCARNAKPFEYAFLLDALKEEQSQGVTVDSARVFFKTPARDYLLIDAPGHVEFLRNMVSGASRAQAALLVVDAVQGVRENTRRHGYLLSMLGLRQVMVVINKMDLVGYAEDRFRTLENDCRVFLKETGISTALVIPVSAFLGDNILSRCERMPWYTGSTLVRGLDAFVIEPPALELPFRMPVQGVYKFTRDGDDRRIIAGTPYAGRLKAGDDVVFYPSGKKAQVKTIESDTPVEAGLASGFTLSEQVYVTRSQVAVRADEPPPSVSSVFRARLFWMGNTPLLEQRMYILKTGTARVPAFVEKIEQVVDAVTFRMLPLKGRVGRHEAAVCVLRARKPLAVDTGDGPGARFVLVDGYDIAGGGMLVDALDERIAYLQKQVSRRQSKWVAGAISADQRGARHGQKPFLVLVTGKADAPRKDIARALEQALYAIGREAYFLGFGSVLYGVDADLKVPFIDEAEGPAYVHWEEIRRFAEVVHILLDCGLIVVVSAAGLTREDMEELTTALSRERMMIVTVGPSLIDCDVALEPLAPVSAAVDTLMQALRARQVFLV